MTRLSWASWDLRFSKTKSRLHQCTFLLWKVTSELLIYRPYEKGSPLHYRDLWGSTLSLARPPVDISHPHIFKYVVGYWSEFQTIELEGSVWAMSITLPICTSFIFSISIGKGNNAVMVYVPQSSSEDYGYWASENVQLP